MNDPRVPQPEHRSGEDVRGEVGPPESPGRPEVIREEIVGQEARSYRDSPRHTVEWARTLGLWVAVAAGVTELLLLFRLAFFMAGSSASAGFVSFIYSSTNWMVSPFQGIAQNFSTPGGTIESAGGFAVIIYLVAALIVITALRVLGSVPEYGQSGGRQTRAPS